MADPRPTRPSAAVVLLRGERETLECYWVLRSDAVPYMPGFRAFVGGTVNREDEALDIEGLSPGVERTLRACAIRETFEETGVLLVRAIPAGNLAEARRRLLEGETSFGDLAQEHGWRFDASDLEPAGRWISPPFAAARFETTFHLARVPLGQSPEVIPGELASGEWVTPLSALGRWYQGQEGFAAPILYTLISLAEGEQDLHERMARWPEASGQPVRRIELVWGIVLHPMQTRPLPPATHTNAYLVGEREMALIDPGSGEPEELERLFSLLDLLASDGRRLKLVLLTHGHPDHIGGVEAVRSRTGVPVAGHAEIASRVRIDITLGDGDWIPLVPGPAGDWTLRALHTPGHAREHLCFLHPRSGSLFSGDHVVGGSGTVIVDPPEGGMGDYIASLERLLREPARFLFPAHGAPQGAATRRISTLLQHRLAREAKVESALVDAPASLQTLVPRVYDDTPKGLWPYAERSLLAHLLKLESEGRAVRQGDGWRRA